jgi:hypothetical protein
MTTPTQYREYVGGSTYDNGGTEYLKVIGETYDGAVYTGDLHYEGETAIVGECTTASEASGLFVPANTKNKNYDAAFKFASWVSVEFELYLIKEFQRLKEEEQKQLGWSAKRELAKINYRIHTDAIKQNLIPKELTPQQKSFVYADEADMLNVAMFGKTAKEWREENPDLKGNIRDYATINQLICLSNMENLNAVFINEGLAQSERLEKLNKIAIQQMKVLENVDDRRLLKDE